MAQTLTAKGYIYPPEAGTGGSCGGCSSGPGAVSVAPFEVAFRSGCAGETYPQARSGACQVNTEVGQWLPLPLTDGFTSIQLLALRTSAPLSLRLRGLGARAVTACSFPNAVLAGQSLGFTLDAVLLVMTFDIGEDTALEVAARINSAAALAGLSYQPASVTSAGQVAIEGAQTGPSGALSAFSGSAAATLGLAAFLGAQGGGSDVAVDGLFIAQFPKPGDLTRIEVNGQASVSVLAAGT